MKLTKRPRGATGARQVAPRAHSRTGRFAAYPGVRRPKGVVDVMNGIVFLSILVLPGPLIAQPDQEPQPKPLAITHVTVIDCTGKAAQPDMTVIVASERITALGKAKDVAMPEGHKS
jgi:hypothetical protein